ncbi:HAD family hydrolase [Streptomyces sp. NRRL F-2664]|uniref:HAD family hydrolase n=1 Tax=Streptomyces sp. NRRL F-2664 TaxID=1463842 RepID=UPI0004CC2EF1|nr:HAD-IA family hydrolase [Streptomyces sp. NRRL F-2664]
MPTPSEALADVIGASAGVLFDFDGPVCDVFGGLPAPQVAVELAGIVATRAPSLADRARATDDPMEIHRLSQEGGADLLAAVEAALTTAEVAAVKVAGPPVAGAVQTLKAARASDRRVAVVSNNSAECVREYLELHGIAGAVEVVVGRPVLRPDLMKPAPHPLLAAAAALDVEPAATVLIGDSTTDVEAARAAGTRSIGFANKPQKHSTLADAGADVVVQSMEAVADALASAAAADQLP